MQCMLLLSLSRERVNLAKDYRRRDLSRVCQYLGTQVVFLKDLSVHTMRSESDWAVKMMILWGSGASYLYKYYRKVKNTRDGEGSHSSDLLSFPSVPPTSSKFLRVIQTLWKIFLATQTPWPRTMCHGGRSQEFQQSTSECGRWIETPQRVFVGFGVGGSFVRKQLNWLCNKNGDAHSTISRHNFSLTNKVNLMQS